MKKVAVIGAGPSGITAIKNFVDQGFEVTAFERCEGVGGTGDSMTHLDTLAFLRQLTLLVQNIHPTTRIFHFLREHRITLPIKSCWLILMAMQKNLI